MEQFVKLSEVRKMLDYAYDGMELERLFSKLKIYNAEYKPYMPIRIRDYGCVGGEPHEYDCGADQNHHWLQIEDDGRLRFFHMQCGAVTVNEEVAKDEGECCFIPTYEHDDEFGDPERYITPERLLVLQEEGAENQED